MAVLVPTFSVLAIMTAREYWQYITKQTPVFEWEDLTQYSVVIMMALVTVGMILAAIGVIE